MHCWNSALSAATYRAQDVVSLARGRPKVAGVVIGGAFCAVAGARLVVVVIDGAGKALVK